MKTKTWLSVAAGALLLSAAVQGTVSAADDAEVARFYTLGTGGGPVEQDYRSRPANALVAGDAIYLFDVGDGVLSQLKAAGLDMHKVRAVFISHHHLDHNGDLSMVVMTRWLLGHGEPLDIIGPPGVSFLLEGIVAGAGPIRDASFFIDPRLANKPFESVAGTNDLPKMLNEPQTVYEDDKVKVFAITNDHFHGAGAEGAPAEGGSYAYRIEAGGRSIVYTGDTGPSENLTKLAQGADMMVSEVIDLDATRRMLEKTPGMQPEGVERLLIHMRNNHLTPEDIGLMATRANIGEVVLTHFVPGAERPEQTEGYSAGVSVHYEGPVRAARDLDAF